MGGFVLVPDQGMYFSGFVLFFETGFLCVFLVVLEPGELPTQIHLPVAGLKVCATMPGSGKAIDNISYRYPVTLFKKAGRLSL